MMFGLETLATAGLSLLMNVSSACGNAPPPVVEIFTKNGQPRYHYNRSSAELSGYHIDTTFARAAGETYTVGGLTQGKLTISRNMEFALQRLPGGNACLTVTRVQITVDYTPDVFIAREYRPGTCRYNVTMEHEVQHVNIDIYTLNEFIPRIKYNVQQIVNGMPPQGPIAERDIDRVKQRMADTAAQGAHTAIGAMDQARHARHQRIDTREEYIRLSRACAHERNPINMR